MSNTELARRAVQLLGRLEDRCATLKGRMNSGPRAKEDALKELHALEWVIGERRRLEAEANNLERVREAELRAAGEEYARFQGLINKLQARIDENSAIMNQAGQEIERLRKTDTGLALAAADRYFQALTQIRDLSKSSADQLREIARKATS